MKQKKKKENNHKKKNKKKERSKIKYIFLIITLLLSSLLIFFYNFNTFKNEKSNYAHFIKINGSVKVNSGNGWKEGKLNQKLYPNDKIKVLSGKATLIIRDSIICILNKGTEINIKSLEPSKIVFKQEKGSTWNKFRKLTGIESYEVETPYGAATIRGTEFSVIIKDNKTTVEVAEGSVNLKNKNTIKQIEKLQKGESNNTVIKISSLSDRELKKIIENKKEVIRTLKEIRLKKILENKFIIKILEKRYNISEKELPKYLDMIDKEEVEIDKIIKKLPFKIDNIEELIKLTQDIKKINIEIKDINDSIKK